MATQHYTLKRPDGWTTISLTTALLPHGTFEWLEADDTPGEWCWLMREDTAAFSFSDSRVAMMFKLLFDQPEPTPCCT